VLTGPVRVYSSPFERAVRTAVHLHLGAPVEAAELADRDWGTHFSAAAGGDQAERRAQAQRGTTEDPWGWRPAGGESVRDVHRRVERFLDLLAGTGRAESVVLVSHGEVLRAARMIIEGSLHLPLATRADGTGDQRVPNGGLIVYTGAAAGIPRYRWRGFVARPGDAPAGWAAGPVWSELAGRAVTRRTAPR
jgi:broad specificity phosphatase PhoE